MNREIVASKLADVTLTVKPLPITAAQLQALGRLPNVVAVDPRSTFSTRIYIGALINTITMAVLERTREIGILRCIGGHARDVRRIFATEGLVVALAGWLIGIPLGLALAHGLTTLTENVINVHLIFAFPFLNIPIALIGTLVLALLVMQIPLRRAVRFKPGEALRYA